MTGRSPISSGAVWTASDVGAPITWTDVLDDSVRAAIVDAARAAVHAGLTPETVTSETFARPAIAERVERSGPEVRLYRTNARQDFHTDGADVIGLLCLHRAKAGGESRIVSAAAVYNELLRRDPQLVETLYASMPWDRNGEESPGEPPYYELPVLTDVDGRPRFFYIGWYIRDAQRHAAAPRLTDMQLDAMEQIEAIANDPAFHVEMDFRPGDIQWLNNSVILHSREAYEDDPDPAERRHLLRLWLRAHDFAAVEDLLRGGIPAQRGI